MGERDLTTNARGQQTGLEAVRVGAAGREVDAAARAVIEDAGYGERVGHGLGYGVGLEVHEAPTLSRRSADEHLSAGMVVTVEPGIYLPGRGGVRIEDLVVGELAAGGNEIRTGLPKTLSVCESEKAPVSCCQPSVDGRRRRCRGSACQ